MAGAAPADLVTLPGLLALGAQDFPAQQQRAAAPPPPRALFGRLIAQSPAQWAAFDPHAPFALSYGVPMPLVFATDAAGVGELLAHRADARAALRFVGWTDADVAAYAGSKLVKLVVFDAHVGLNKAIRRMFQGCCWQRCRVHHHFAEVFAYARNLLQRVPKAHQGMVTAALRSVFAQETAAEIQYRWDDLAASLAERFPKEHWKKVWSTNLLERVNVAPIGALGELPDQAPY
jgi:hypothetical protein